MTLYVQKRKIGHKDKKCSEIKNNYCMIIN